MHKSAKNPMLINGESVGVLSALDRGFQYGDGLFETISVSDGVLCLWERHLSRLSTGCARIGIKCPDPKLLKKEALAVINSKTNGVCKIVISRGIGGRGYNPQNDAIPTRVVAAFDKPIIPESLYSTGAVVRICNVPLSRNPILAGLKHLNCLEQVMARREWDDEQIYEGLMLDSLGNVIEGTMTNIFLIEEGSLVTPDLSQSGVAGVVRSLVLDEAEQLGLSPQVEPISANRLRQANALFLTNSVVGMIPIRQCESVSYDVTQIPESLKESIGRSVFAD